MSVLGGFIAIALLYFFFLLSSGIHLRHFQIYNTTLNGLYLKLDNKLVLTLDELVLTSDQSESSTLNPQDAFGWFQNSLIAMSYFQKIQIKKIIFPNKEQASILYDGKQYELIFPSLKAHFEITQKQDDLLLEVEKLDFEQMQIALKGSLNFSPHKKQLVFNLIANTYRENINESEKAIIKGDSNLKKLNVQIYTTPIKNLKAFQKEIAQLPTLDDWLMQKASFDSIRITNLYFTTTLDERFTKNLLKSLYAEVQVSNVNLKLQEALEPIQTPLLTMRYKSNKLGFELENPTYADISLQGSKVEILDLDSNPKTIVSLRSTNAVLDERMHQLLQAYDVDFDINQSSSLLDLKLQLAFSTNQDDTTRFEALGEITSQNAQLDIFGMPLFAKTLKTQLDITPEEQKIYITESEVALENPKLSGLIDCQIDLNTQQLTGEITPQLLDISFGDTPITQILKIQNATQPFDVQLDFADQTTLTIPEFETQIIFDTNKQINLENLSKLYPFSPMLQHLAIQAGSANLQTKDFEHFIIQTRLKQLTYPIFDSHWNPITELEATIKIDPHNFSLATTDNHLQIDFQDQFLKVLLKNYYFTTSAIQDNKVPILAFLAKNQEQEETTEAQQQHSDTPTLKVYFESQNSKIKYKQVIVPSDEIVINYKNGKIKGDLMYKNGIANLDFYDDIIKFKANNFSPSFVNTLFGKDIVEGGLFGIKGIYKNKVLRAEVEIQNTIFKNFATLQNVLGLIDTIPSLIVFKKPGLGANGYQIEQGRIRINLNDEYLALKKIDLVGNSIDVSGGGIITLATQEMDIALTISTIKSLSEVLSKIPIVGYLLLGKEGKISTGVILKGTLEKPKSEVTIAEDIISAPFKIIERIFTSD
ncbi:hypothetical protein BBW65_02580 [Helicobacter enhydrae]|uniref:YhdP central domain-containing protein n=1 Tax=Helicobacter enhydrae TaxID=222136 RepID=A0A1B1U4N0_9HELI|nr:hypothetical protein BBW65_02580 [Helicobacter enhydrae]